MKKILVTGGCGFIGSELVKRLVHNGNNVVVLDNCSRGSAHRLKEIIKDIDFIEGDIRDYDVVSNACNGVTSIHHLAYINGTENFYNKPELVLDVATSGIINLYNYCKKNQIEDFYLASTSEVYQTPEKFPANEEERLIIPNVMNPRFSYGGGKILCELIAIHCIQKIVKKLIIYRPHNVYGPDMGNEHVIPQFFLRMKALNLQCNKNDDLISFSIQGTGEETRSFIHISDFVDSLELLMKYGTSGNIYHLGNSDEICIRDLALLVAEELKLKIRVKPGPLQIGSTLRRCPDIRKILEIGYKQKISIKKGISSLKEWYS